MKKIIKKTYEINAPVEKVWKALVDPETITEWGGQPLKMDERVGTEFQLWNGDVHGKNIEVISEKLLVQEWYSGGWPKPSLVKFNLKSVNHKTILELDHTDVPDEEFDDVDEGWDIYYIGPMKELLEKQENK